MRYLTVKEYASLKRISTRTVYRMIRKKVLAVDQVSKGYSIRIRVR